MKVLYFAWLKEKVGVSQENLGVPDGVKDVAELVAWMQQRDDKFADAFSNADIIRVAVNHEYVERDHAVAEGDEIAFFPPVTGG